MPDAGTFTFDGRRIPFRAGDTVASALHRAGVRVLSRSPKYHRPRGLFCGVGRCSACMVRVGGTPNVRACIEPATDGDVVRSQNAVPRAGFDVLRVFDVVLPKSLNFQTSFTRPRFLRPLYNRVIRGLAGVGDTPEPPDAQWDAVPALDVDVLVVGGGVAGVAAAEAARNAGAAVTLVEEREDGLTIDGVDVRHGTRAFAVYPGRGLAVETRRGVGLWRPRRIIIASGGYDRSAVFDGNDLPGIMLASGAVRLARDHGLAPGRRVVVHGVGHHAAAVASTFHDVGASVVALAGPGDPADGVMALRDRGTPVLGGATIEAALGFSRVEGVRYRTDAGPRTFACDAVVLAEGIRPALEFFHQARCALAYRTDLDAMAPVLDNRLETTVRGVFACGAAAGFVSLDAARSSGQVAGAAAARSLAERSAGPREVTS